MSGEQEEGPMTPGGVVKDVDVASSEEDMSDDLKKPHTMTDEERHLHPDARLEHIPMRFLKIDMPGGGALFFNWFTSLFGFAALWGLSIWCMADPSGAKTELGKWNDKVNENFTWFYIVANPSFTFFVFYLAIRYGNVKLGKKDEEPEFSDLSYFAMLFSAGVAVGLFFYGVSEPLWHQNSHWFANAGYHSQDEIDQFAMMITVYHWGFAGWSPYLIVGIAAGIAAYRFDLPLNVRTTLFPLLGPYTWGWIGDVVDGFSIVMTVAGICTSLGLGAMQLSAGFKRLGWVATDLSEDEETNINIAIIWVVTGMATVSVVTGLKMGIKFLSQLGFGLGMAQLMLCFFMDNTKFILNLMVQTTGYYFQWCIFQIPFWTDAFASLPVGQGHAVDGREAADWWMGGWTVFYMAWWTAWGAFVGLFIARVSRGRTIRQVVIYALLAPLIYGLLWFCVFGGTGIRQSRQAMELEVLGETSFGNSTHFLAEGSSVCYDVPQQDIFDENGTLVFTNTLPGVTPVCQFDTSDGTAAWFNVMYSFSYPDENGFGGFGGFLSVMSLIAITIYFVTSSDSGSLVVDHLSANGHEEHHWAQRVFWAFTEGAVATALLTAGGSDALGALQAASIVFGLPFNLFLFLMMASILKMCNYAELDDANDKPDSELPNPKTFRMPIFGGIFNIVEFIVSAGSVHPERVALGMDMPTTFQVVEFFTGLLLPFWSLFRILGHLPEEYSPIWRVVLTVLYLGFFVGWVVLMAFGAINVGFVCIGWAIFFGNACILTNVRLLVRSKYELDGNAVADFLTSAFAYPQVLCQILDELEHGPLTVQDGPIEIGEGGELEELAPKKDYEITA